MKIGIMQPYLFPYIGYWQLIKAVDTYVVYDDAAYIKGGWINRNNYLFINDKKLFTIQIKGASSYKLIKDIEIIDSFSNFIKMLKNNYSKAPYFLKTMELINKIISFDKCNLALFISNSIQVILDYLNINVDVILSSSVNKNDALKGKDKVIDICKVLNASDYYNAIGGMELYNKQEFLQNNIKLFFLKTNITWYKQFNNDFIPGLSIIDIMMFNSIKEINLMLDNFDLI